MIVTDVTLIPEWWYCETGVGRKKGEIRELGWINTPMEERICDQRGKKKRKKITVQGSKYMSPRPQHLSLMCTCYGRGYYSPKSLEWRWSNLNAGFLCSLPVESGCATAPPTPPVPHTRRIKVFSNQEAPLSFNVQRFVRDSWQSITA